MERINKHIAKLKKDGFTIIENILSKTFPKLNRGFLCSTCLKTSNGNSPTLCVGESVVINSGLLPSNDFISANNLSYS